ncbi:MAG: hypothetical protein GY859_21815, partial [Desulfobacterales bacterium]|nr:hypothetical protein [Desulfobacterales bacterium]
GRKDAAQRLHEACMDYLAQWWEVEEELASLMHVRLIRPTISAVLGSNVLESTMLNGLTHQTKWKGVSIDLDLKTIEGVSVAKFKNFEDPMRVYMKSSSMFGSMLESEILEKHFGISAVSTASLFARANQAGVPMATIDASNYTEILPGLPLADNVKADMENAVAAQSLVVHTPEHELAFENWSGAAYLKENPDTGESGWMLSGRIAGGMSASPASMWPPEIRATMEHPYTEPAVFDPETARTIRKITASDRQNGIVGRPLEKPLQVLVKDDLLRPVAGAEVHFTVRAGGGSFPGGEETVTVLTDVDGVARVGFIPGEKTSDNPTERWLPGDALPHQAGENIIEAALSSKTTTRAPFSAFGFPDEPAAMVKLKDASPWTALMHRGSLSAALEDRYGNPVANREIEYTAQWPLPKEDCPYV